MVDTFVAGLDHPESVALSTETKVSLVDLLNHGWHTQAGVCNGIHAIEQTVEALIRAMKYKCASHITIPRLIELKKTTRHERA